MPRWFRLVYSVLVALLVPVYLWHYPPVQFLWLSNVALIGGLVAAWTGSGRLAGMLLVAVGWFEVVWIVDFVGGVLLGGAPPLDIVHYMFDPDLKPMLRALSLYHLPLPFALFWMAWRFGLERDAWLRWLPIGWAILLLSYLLTAPGADVNWVHGGPFEVARAIPGPVWLAGVMTGCAIAWWISQKLIERLLLVLGREPV